MAPTSALDGLRQIRALPGHTFLSDASSLADPAISLDWMAGTRHVTDAHLVNLAAANHCVLATFDRRLLAAVSPSDEQHVFVIPI